MTLALAGHPLLVEKGVTMMLKSPSTPSSWSFYLVSLGAMMALAGLDFLGAVFVKEWTERNNPALLLAGMLTFVVLYFVYAASLHVAELSIVTFGWIVFLQVGLVILDTVHYGVRFPAGTWVAIVAILLLQAYLILSPNAERAAAS